MSLIIGRAVDIRQYDVRVSSKVHETWFLFSFFVILTDKHIRTLIIDFGEITKPDEKTKIFSR